MGIGTVINSVAIVLGGILGLLLKNLFSENMQDGLKKSCGLSVIFIAIAGAMEGMLKVNDGILISWRSMLVVLSLTIGTFIGEIIQIENLFSSFAEWLKIKTGNNGDKNFINAFITATFTVCIGAMAIVGAIEDGLSGDYSILVTKSILDFIIIAVLASSMGKGAIFSAIPVFIFEGIITVIAKFISPILTGLAINYISLIGSILIFCVGINLIWENKIKVANMLPSLIVAIIFSYLKIL